MGVKKEPSATVVFQASMVHKQGTPIGHKPPPVPLGHVTFQVQGTPIPQGRPKVAVRGKFPHVYYSKRGAAYRATLVQIFEGAGRPAWSRACVVIEAFGMRASADPDNLAKQVLDALVSAGVLSNDTCKVVRALHVFCHAEKRAANRLLEVTVQNLG